MGKVLIQVSASEEARAAAQANALSDKPLILPRTNLTEEYLPREEPKPAAQGGESASKESGSSADVDAVSRKKVGACQHLHVLHLVVKCRGPSFQVTHKPLLSLGSGHALEVSSRRMLQ